MLWQRYGKSAGINRTLMLIMVFVAIVACPAGYIGAATGEDDQPVIEIRTTSPRETLESFQRLTRELQRVVLAYRQNHSRANWHRAGVVVRQFFQLMDLSSVPPAALRQIGFDTAVDLIEIFGRIEMPPMESIPGPDEVSGDDGAIKRVLVPGTPISLVRIDGGAREGEYLFSDVTPEVAPLFLSRIEHRPVLSSLVIVNWREAVAQLHGPMIPARLIDRLPAVLKRLWLDTPLWKITFTAMLAILISMLVMWGYRRLRLRALEHRFRTHLGRLLMPVVTILAVFALVTFIHTELNIAGAFARLVDVIALVVFYLVVVWIFWSTMVVAFEWIILSPRISDQSLDANLLRLCARVIAFVGSVFLLAYGAQELGLPVLGLLAGLGVGGLAVALAIRPTLENLIGGVILFIDKPVRVGDFCSFGQNMGTVEYIGVRSTEVRALDRTLISIPNATFADMEIVNWAKCDRMLIHRKIGLRYETRTDQLRYVLAKLREMCFAHPKIDSDTVRIRFVGPGEASLNIDLRIYAQTREWNEFYAVQEDVFLRVAEIVLDSGTAFAFPSQTLYVGRDPGVDAQRSDEVTAEVSSWRRSRRLPFPGLTPERIEELDGTLDYPPRGSPDFASDADELQVAEPLSAAGGDEPLEDPEKENDADRK